MALTIPEQQLVEQRLANEARSTLLAYVLWFFLAGFGAHRFYLGRVFSALGMMALFWLGAATTVIIVGWLLLLVYGIWWVIDAFLIPGMVDADRQRRRVLIASDIRAASGR